MVKTGVVWFTRMRYFVPLSPICGNTCNTILNAIPMGAKWTLQSTRPKTPVSKQWMQCLCSRALGADNLCQISSGNVIAFSASGGPEEGLNVSARGYHVFVADLNTPWDLHLWVSGLQFTALGANRFLVRKAVGFAPKYFSFYVNTLGLSSLRFRMITEVVS